MGGVASAVGGFIGGAIESVGHIAESAVREIGHAAENVGREIGKIGQAAVNNPIGTIAKVAAVASGQWWALPLVSAVDVVAHGGDIGQAALAAGVSVAASWAGGQIASQIAAPAADSVATAATQQASDLAAGGFTAEQISSMVQGTHGISANIADSIAAATVAGVAPQTLASAYAGAFGQQLTGAADAFSQKLIATSLGNSAANFAKTLVQTGGDVEKALAAGAGAGIGTGFGGIVSNELANAGVNNSIAQITGKITAGATSGIVQGQDPSKAIGSALVSNIIATSYAQAGQAFKTAWEQSGASKLFSDLGVTKANELNELAAKQKTAVDQSNDLLAKANAESEKFNGLLNSTKQYYESTLTPAQQEAERLQAQASSYYDQYKAKSDEFSGLVKQYDDVKAKYDALPDKYDENGNVIGKQDKYAYDPWGEQSSVEVSADTLRNQLNELADKANGLVPSLNTATDNYNNAANAYQSAYDKFKGIADTYQGYNNQLATIKQNFTSLNGQLDQSSAQVKQLTDQFNSNAKSVQEQVDHIISQKIEADKVVEDLPEAAKQAYLNAFSTGQMPMDAANIGTQVSKLSDISQDSFNKGFNQGLSIDESLQLANNVNSLAKPQQNYFDFATNTGLDVNQALAVAPSLSGMSVTAQQAFFDQVGNNKLDPAQALDWASKVNSLDSKQQLAFSNAVLTGLSQDQALQFAPKVSDLTANQQISYLNSIKQGMSGEAADLVSAFSALAGSDKTSFVDPNAANLAKLTNDDQKQAYMELVSGAGGLKVSPDKAMAFVTQGIDPITGQKIAEGFVSTIFGVGNAQAGELPAITKTPEGKDLVESIYKQDPTTGKWTEYLPDGKGGYTPMTSTLLVGNYTAGPTGNKYVLDDAQKDLLSGMPPTPYTGATPTDTATSSGSAPVNKKSELDNELATGKLTQAEYTELLKTAVDDTKPTVDQTIGGTSTWQDYINNLLTQSKATAGSGSGTTGTGGTGTSGGTTAGSGTGTTGSTTSGGPAAGTGTTPGGTSNAGTGSGIGSTPGGAGTGEGTGTGTGTGGTGTGTGGGGTGTGGGGGAGTLGGGASYGTWLASQGQDQYGGIKNLTPGLTERMDYTLTGMPTIQEAVNPTTLDTPEFAAGGSTSYDPFGSGSSTSSGLDKSLTPGLTKAQIQYILTGLPGSNISVQGHAEGGEIEGHNPQFFSEGGLGSIDNRYVQGEGDGTSDSVAAMLANGEFVIPADVVSKLGNGSNEAGAGVLDQFLAEIRKHANSNGTKLPPESKGPLAYLLDAKRKVKA